jgi:cytoskeletal protein CcmA (bactofilin family)
MGVIAVVVTSPLPAFAFTPLAGDIVVFSRTIQDDLYIAGRSVTVNGTIDGDVAAAGGDVELDGQVSGDALAAGGTLRIGGAVGRSLRASAGTLNVDARIGRDAVLAGGTVNVSQAAQVGRDLVVGGGTITLSGTVSRDAVIRGGTVVIGGTIQGNARVRANQIVLLPTARIGGKLRYAAGVAIQIPPGARISGGTEQIPAPLRRGAAIASQLWRSLAEALALLVLGLVIFAVAPRGASAVVANVGRRFGRSLLTGFILVVVVPAAAILLLVTLIGIPVSLVAMLLYLATLYPGQVFVASWLGSSILRVVRRGTETPPSTVWSLVLGTVILVLLFAIPYGGWGIHFVAILIGFGALWLTVWGAVARTPGPPVAGVPGSGVPGPAVP